MLDTEITQYIKASPDGGADWLVQKDGFRTTSLDFGTYRAVITTRGDDVGYAVTHERFGELRPWTKANNTPNAKLLSLQFIGDHIAGNIQ